MMRAFAANCTIRVRSSARKALPASELQASCINMMMRRSIVYDDNTDDTEGVLTKYDSQVHIIHGYFK